MKSTNVPKIESGFLSEDWAPFTAFDGEGDYTHEDHKRYYYEKSNHW